MRHGLRSTYVDHHCSCPECRAANTEYQAQGNRERHQRMLSGEVTVPHGVLSTYKNYICRCEPCVATNAAACKKWRARRT